MRLLHVTIASFVCLAAFSLGRVTQEELTPGKKAGNLSFSLKMNELNAQLENLGQKPKEDTKVPDLNASYEAVAADPQATRIALSGDLGSYFSSSAGAKSAAQATQVASEASVRMQALQVAQNARIITLLEQIAAQKK